MRKTLVGVLAIASLGLGGCVAVPAYEPGPVVYGYGPPPAVVVAPTVGFGYSRYYGGPRYYGHYHHGWRR